MQQHVARHLEAVALLSVPNLDEDKKPGKGDSNSANNHVASRDGAFDSTEVSTVPENEGPEELLSSSEAEKRALRTKLESWDQSFNKASSESVVAKSRSWEDIIGNWLEVVYRVDPKDL